MANGTVPSLVPHWPGVWRGRSLQRHLPTLPSGHAQLDRSLPGHGWPLGTLTELLADGPGNGEFNLLSPALADLTTRGRWVTLVDPPWIPYPPAMQGHGIALEHLMLIRTRCPQESLWACEQVLHGISGGAVLGWHEDPGFARLRRLQLAARTGRQAVFLFRSSRVARQPSPAALRLQLQADADGTRIRVLKCQGRGSGETLLLRHPPHLPGSRPGPQHDATKPDSPALLPGERRRVPPEARAH